MARLMFVAVATFAAAALVGASEARSAAQATVRCGDVAERLLYEIEGSRVPSHLRSSAPRRRYNRGAWPNRRTAARRSGSLSASARCSQCAPLLSPSPDANAQGPPNRLGSTSWMRSTATPSRVEAKRTVTDQR